MTVEEGDHAVVQKIGRRDRRLAIIELGASNLGVGVDEVLLVDPPDPLQIANIERVLGAAVARMLALKFAMGLLLGLGLFQRDELGLGQYQAFLGALGLQGFEPLVHGLEVMTLPHATHAGGRDREPALPQLVGDADLGMEACASSHYWARELLAMGHDVRLTGDFDLRTRVNWVEESGGASVAPHPRAQGHQWTDEELYEIPWLRGIERNIDLWDALLKADRPRWEVATDDFHSVESGVNKGFVVVNSSSSVADAADIISNIRQGNFYSVIHAKGAGSYYYPRIERVEQPLGGFQKEVRVTSLWASTIRGIDGNGKVTTYAAPSAQNPREPWSVTFPLNGDEGYLRFELSDQAGTVAYSQPLFVFGRSREDCQRRCHIRPLPGSTSGD